VAEGITINGFAIVQRTRVTAETATLDRYFADALIGGPNAFIGTGRHRDDTQGCQAKAGAGERRAGGQWA
jgi:hypothetical protein